MAQADALVQHVVARLTERIEAAQQLLAANSDMTPAEHVRFATYIEKLKRQRAALEGTPGDNDDEDMTEARVNNVEATLRLMDDRLTRIVEQIHQLDVRTGRLEDNVAGLKEGQRATADQVRSLADQLRTQESPEGYSRLYLAGGALAMTIVIALLLVLTWRML